MIQWYPGHMAKAKREIAAKLKLVDLVFELVDARIPLSSRNPDLKALLEEKPKVLLLMKKDLSDERFNQYFCNELKKTYREVVLFDAKRDDIKKISSAAMKVLSKKKEEDAKRGITGRPVRALIVGIPNVGKSTLVNRLAQKKKTKVGNIPGVTRFQQWINVNDELYLLDTPGVLPPKFIDKKVGYNLAITGAIKDTVFPKDDLILYLLDFLKLNYPASLLHYQVDVKLDNLRILNKIASAKKYYIRGHVDYDRVYDLILNDFRSLRLGRITLDR